MCGIAGIVSRKGKPFDPDKIKKMCDVLSHRGPDDAGYVFFRLGERVTGEGGYWCGFSDPLFRQPNKHLPVFGSDYYREEISRHPITVGFGHRRLSIIDLSHYGHQPMSSSDRRYWVVFNGEIYNFPELKIELESKGHIFRTRTDTEVLLHLWEEFGVDSIKMLNGMFAFAIYDRVKNELLLARDRFGVKPLYYALTDDFLVFASEPKSILASGLIKPEIDPAALVEYMTFQNIFCDKTLFKNIKLLPPGCILQMIPVNGRDQTFINYHNGCSDFHAGSFSSNENLLDEVVARFDKAVCSQLISDVPVGSYLSGGMDSGSIVAVAGRSIPRLLTFTGGFDLTNVNGIEQGFDERPLAEKLSYLLQTEHYAMVLHAGDMPAAMERITWHVDDPRVGMCHQNWYVAKLASKFVKVCLAGAGGDELFGGYPWRYRNGLLANDITDFDNRYFRYWNRLLSPEELPNLLSSDLHGHFPSVRESFQSVMDGAPPENSALSREHNLLQRALYFEYKTFLHGFLIIEDRVSMAHSLETRVPFLDNDLADLAWQIPPQFKVDISRIIGENSQKHMETAEGKIILRQAMEQFLPREFTQQKKQGFSPPDENWYRGPSMAYIKDILLDPVTYNRPWFNQTFVQGVLSEHFDGKKNHRLLIWSLLCLEWLQRHYLDNKVGETNSD